MDVAILVSSKYTHFYCKPIKIAHEKCKQNISYVQIYSSEFETNFLHLNILIEYIYFVNTFFCIFKIVLLIYSMKQHIVSNKKNDVIQYKWPMIGQYSFYHWSITMHTGLSFVICFVWRHFLGTISCLIFKKRSYSKTK